MDEIYKFIEHVWADAKKELSQIDTQFVATIGTTKRLQQGRQFWVPSVHPTQRLSKQWTEILETTTDLVWQVELLSHSAHVRSAALARRTQGQQAGRQRDYAFTNWIHQAYALIKKVDRLITLICQIYLGRQSNWQSTRRKFVDQLNNDVKANLDKIRTPLAHGAGGNGMFVRGITEDLLWEHLVALEFKPVDLAFFIFEAVPQQLSKQPDRPKSVTEEVLRRIGRILQTLEHEVMITSIPMRHHALSR